MNECQQGEMVKDPKVKKKVKGWSTEEMEDKPSSSLEEDTEEMRKWRGMSQSEMDLCWKKLAERMEEEVQDKYKVEESKREACRGRGALLEWRRVRKKQEIQNKNVERRLLGKHFLLDKRIQLTEFAKQTRGVDRRGGDEAAAKDGYHERSDQ